MKSKNRKERRISFLKFTALFMATALSIQAAVYFNYTVPEKDNELLRKSVSTTKAEREFQHGFFEEMKGLKRLIDSMDIEGQNTSYQNNMINAKIVELQNKIPPKDSTYLYDMHMDVINLYVELQKGKVKLLALKEAETTIEEYKSALDGCREDYEQMERALRIERRSR